MNFRDPGLSFREPGLSFKDRVKSFVTLCFTNNQDQFDDSGLAEDIDMLVDEVRYQALAAPLNTNSDSERGKYCEGVFYTDGEFQAELLRWKGLSRQHMSDEMWQKGSSTDEIIE